jgi:hypothetical protein
MTEHLETADPDLQRGLLGTFPMATKWHHTGAELRSVGGGQLVHPGSTAMARSSVSVSGTRFDATLELAPHLSSAEFEAAM